VERIRAAETKGGRLSRVDRPRISEIGALPLRSPKGNYVTLKQLAAIDESSGRYVILHQGARRVQTITCNVQGRAVGSFVDEGHKRISRMSIPADTYEFSGTAEAQAPSRRDLLVNSILAGLGIVLLLSVVMGNYHNMLLVLANLPFALVGGVLAGLFTGGNLSLGSLVGFVNTVWNHPAQFHHADSTLRASG